MTVNFIRKRVGGTRLRFLALVFASLFFASSFEVYRAERQVIKDQDQASEEIKSLLEDFTSTSESALTVTVLSGCESESHDQARSVKKLNRACDLYRENKQAETATLNALKSYEETLRSLSSAVEVNKEGSVYFLHFAGHGLAGTTGNAAFELRLNNSVRDYSSERLYLESEHRSGNLSKSEYTAKLSQLSMAYSERFSPLEQIENEQSLRSEVNSAEERLTDLQARVELLEKQLAKAERTPFEKWCPIINCILTLLSALSANFVAWRSDRRQKREAELLSLKRQDMKQSIILKEQQLQETKGIIITPTREELNRYSRNRHR